MLFEERVSIISFMSYLMDIGCLELIGVCNTVCGRPKYPSLDGVNEKDPCERLRSRHGVAMLNL
jgi:hypothetical protein